MRRLRARVAALALAACGVVACGTLLAVEPDDPLPGGPEGGGDVQATDAADDASSADGGEAAAADVDAAPVRKLVFVTNELTNGDLAFLGVGEGRALADAQCTNEASSVGVPGQFYAWISIAGSSAVSRLAPNGEWHTPAGGLVFASRADIIAGKPPKEGITFGVNNASVLNGDPIADTVWTGTNNDGSPSSESCLDWTASGTVSGQIGKLGGDTTKWTNAGMSGSCDSQRHVLCFEK